MSDFRIKIDRASSRTLTDQAVRGVRSAILDGSLATGTVLPIRERMAEGPRGAFTAYGFSVRTDRRRMSTACVCARRRLYEKYNFAIEIRQRDLVEYLNADH